MTNQQVIILANTGALSATAHDLPAAEAYKLIPFKRAIRKALEEISKKQEEIPADDPKADELKAELMKEEVSLDCKTMSFEAFHALANENKSVPVFDGEGKLIGRFDPFTISEDALENVLWKAPEE